VINTLHKFKGHRTYLYKKYFLLIMIVRVMLYIMKITKEINVFVG